MTAAAITDTLLTDGEVQRQLGLNPKATSTPTRQYARSHNFTLLSAPGQNLQRVGQILKRLVSIPGER